MPSRSWRCAIATVLTGAVVTGGLGSAVVVPTAGAQPADSSTQSQDAATQERTRPVSPDQILMTISQEYQTGAGGGQVSKLIDQVITLRKRGIRPSRSSTQALAAALDKRPNQKPLIDALQATLVDQRRQFARQGIQAPGGAPAVAAPDSSHANISPGWGPDNPMQQDSPIFQSPGR
ncbi:MAG: hypothetical protein K0U76_11090 [Actinomycetia bacterium]|nr:hypothetical protein [Actinomycetes bacterium]MCH9701906.1 hypothetical protein [Actinomycetes bacterium]MCH9761123.1 hypothetical protein [Actinomycetes bacterium]